MRAAVPAVLLLLAACTEENTLQLAVPDGPLEGVVDLTVTGGADRLSVLVDGASLGGGAGPAFTVQWDTTTVADGAHTVSGLGDFAGEVIEVTESVEVLNTVVDDTPLTVAFTSPTEGEVVATQDVHVVLAVTTGGTLTSLSVTADGTTAIDGFTTEWPYEATWSGVSEGAHTLVAEVADSSGQTASAAVAFTVDPEVTCAITSPRDGATVGPSADVSVAAAAGGGVDYVLLAVAGDVVATDDAAPWAFEDVDLSAWDGTSVTLVIEVTGNGGYTCNDDVTVTVGEATPFSVQITAPSEGGSVSGAAVPVRAAIGGGEGASSAELYVDGTLVATDDHSDWVFTWDSTASGAGEHTLEVVGYEAETSATASDTITVTVTE